MKNYTGKSSESRAERDARVQAMLDCMIVEACVHSYVKNEDPPKFTREQIADFVGCSKDHIRRIEESALRKLRLKLASR